MKICLPYLVCLAILAGNTEVTFAQALQSPTNLRLTSDTAVSFSASPATIQEGQSASITWDSTNATACTGTGFNTDGAPSGLESVSPITDTTYSIACTGPEGAASKSASVTVQTTSQGSTPIAVTLNDENTGPRVSEFIRVGTLVINQPVVYRGYRADNVIVTASGKGGALVDSIVSGNAGYSIDFTDGWKQSGFANAHDFLIEHCLIEQEDNGKVILGGGFTLRRSRVRGGEDGLHLVGGNTLLQESIIEEINYIGADPHSDAIQLTSGGAGGSLTVEDSILQCGFHMSNAPLQVNVISGPVVSRRNWYHGGVYYIHGDPQSEPITSTDDMFAYDTSNAGVTSVASLIRPVWWSRQVRPRLSTPYQTPAGEAAGFPGNGTPIN